MAKGIDIYSTEVNQDKTLFVSSLYRMAFLEAFTNACKYGDRIIISNHLYAPVITMTNNYSSKVVNRSSGFGTKAFKDYIKKTSIIDDQAYSVYIVNSIEEYKYE